MSKENQSLEHIMRSLEQLSHDQNIDKAVDKVQGGNSIVDDPNYSQNPLDGLSQSNVYAEVPSTEQIVTNRFAEVASTRAEKREQMRAEYQKADNDAKRQLTETLSQKPVNYLDNDSLTGFVPKAKEVVDSTVFIAPDKHTSIAVDTNINRNDVSGKVQINPGNVAGYAPNLLNNAIQTGGTIATALHGGDINHQHINDQLMVEPAGIHQKIEQTQMNAPYTPSFSELAASKPIGDTQLIDIRLPTNDNTSQPATHMESIMSAETAPTYAIASQFTNFWNSIDGLSPEQKIAKNMLASQAFGPAFSDAHTEIIGGKSYLVQYTDKARLELQPDGTITVGLLTTELMNKNVDIAVGGDNNTPAITYLDLKEISTLTDAGENRTTSLIDHNVTDFMKLDGSLVNNGYDGSKGPATNVWYFPETGHNMSDLFLGSFAPGEGGLTEESLPIAAKRMVDFAGYPISEAVWTTMTISGKQELVLVQPCQRRVLTYIPSIENPYYQVQVANSGQHAYNAEQGIGIPPTPEPTVVAPTRTPDVPHPTATAEAGQLGPEDSKIEFQNKNNVKTESIVNNSTSANIPKLIIDNSALLDDNGEFGRRMIPSNDNKSVITIQDKYFTESQIPDGWHTFAYEIKDHPEIPTFEGIYILDSNKNLIIQFRNESSMATILANESARNYYGARLLYLQYRAKAGDGNDVLSLRQIPALMGNDTEALKIYHELGEDMSAYGYPKDIGSTPWPTLARLQP